MSKIKKAKIVLIFSIILGLPFQLQSTGRTILETGRNGEESVFHPDIKSSAMIEENYDEFFQGTRDNLTIDRNGNLKLNTDIPTHWTNMSSASPPSARWRHSMVYDSAHDRVILFGGNDGARDAETWVYNYTDNSWTNMNPTSPPSARDFHSMVYDSAHDRVILFGGYDGALDAETWVYNFTDNSWTNMNPTSPPGARDYHSMAYDSAHDRVILFGGNDGDFDDETWVYNYTDNSWTNMNPASPPSARLYHTMVYDSAHDRVILFGGQDAIDRNDETWVYNYTDNSWTEMTTTSSPSARFGHSMVYDSAHDRVILFGGFDTGSFDDETWVYNYTDNSWKIVSLTSRPSARDYHSMVYDSAHDRVILFGGYDFSVGRRDETWVYSDYKLFQQGIFTSKLTTFDSISTIKGEILWTPVGQQTGTSLKLQIGFSNTPDDADFIYFTWYNTSFTFELNTKYMKYRALFESSDIWQISSPLLNKTTISYSLEPICDECDESGENDTTLSDDRLILGMIIGAVISCATTVGIIGAVIYSKNKAERTIE